MRLPTKGWPGWVGLGVWSHNDTIDRMVQPQMVRGRFRNIVIWTGSNQAESGTRYTPALYCHLLTFWWWKCRIPALTVWYSLDCNVSSFFCGWCEVWFLWHIQKQQSKCYTCTKSGESGPINVLRLGLDRYRAGARYPILCGTDTNTRNDVTHIVCGIHTLHMPYVCFKT